MDKEISELIFEYTSHRQLDYAEFNEQIAIALSIFYIDSKMENINSNKNMMEFHNLIMLIMIYKLERKYQLFLVDALLFDWHRDHENIASIIQKLKAKEILTILDSIVINKIDYLWNSETDWYGYIRRLFYTLGDINDSDCRQELLKYSNNSDAQISLLANEQLRRIDKR